MGRWLVVGEGGVLAVDRIVTIAQARSAPIRRLADAVGAKQMVDLTFGQSREAVVVLDSGHVVAVSQTPEQLVERLEKADDDWMQ
jgi:regulator of extracellular matrix RemA (YlzA/DUF370 family)